MGCTHAPKVHQHQLETSPSPNTNCGWCATAMAISSQTCHKKNPGPGKGRDITGKTNGEGSNPRDWERFIVWYDAQQFNGTMNGLRAKVITNGDMGDLRTWLEAGKAAVVGIDHGRYVDTGALNGDPAFRGYHGILLKGFRVYRDVPQVQTWDSLFDGRRSGIPSGPQYVAWGKMKEGLKGYAKACGYGKDTWYGVKAVPGIKVEDEGTDPPVEPEVPECPECPPDPCAERVVGALAIAKGLGLTFDGERAMATMLNLQGEDLELGSGELAERIRLALPRNEDFADEPVVSGAEPVPYEDAALADALESA